MAETENERQEEAPRRNSDDQTELYGPKFGQLIDPEPSILSLFKFQMSRVQERSENLVRLLKEAAKLVRAEQVAAEALGALGTHYAAPGLSPRLAQLTELASRRTMASMQLDDGLVQARSRLETFKLALHAVLQAEQEYDGAIVSHLKQSDSGRVISTRGRFHQNMLEALVAAAQLTAFQGDFKKALHSYMDIIVPSDEKEEPEEVSDKAQRLNLTVMAALEQTHYTLDSTSNGPPRGWLNLRTRGLPFSAWTRQFFFIQDCHLMCQAKEDVNANIFLDFKGAIVKDCTVDDRANTFMVKNMNGQTFYFQGESFDAAIAWRVTIDSMIMAAQSEEHSPHPVSGDMASQLTRGRSESSSEWMSSLKSTFSNLKTSATAALDTLESKLADPVAQQQQQPGTPVDPAEAESVMWVVPVCAGSKPTLSENYVECRFMGARPSNLSEAKSFLDSIKLLRANYDVPAPQICRLHKSGADLVIYSQGDSDNALVAKIISLMPCEGDLCGMLVDRDDHAEVWLLEGLDLSARLGSL